MSTALLIVLILVALVILALVLVGGRPARDRRTAASGDGMTRSEEVVTFGKRKRERGRVRLKKYVVTDYVETKVPVKREKVRLEFEPADEDDEREPRGD
jgi:hypothetical protein